MFKGMGMMQSELDEAAIYPIETGRAILKDPVYKEYKEGVAKITNLKPDLNRELYDKLLENYAQFVQQLEKPRDKAKTRMMHVAFRRAYGFIRQVAPMVWFNEGFGFDPDRLIYALYTAALLNGIGRIFQDRTLMLCDQTGKHIGVWFPNTGLLKEGHYKVRATRSLPEEYVKALHVVYAQIILPEMGFAWILEDPKLFLWWRKALEDMQAGFGDLDMDFDIDKLAKGVGEEFNFDEKKNVALPPETLEGEKFLAWLKEKIKNSSSLINSEGSGLYHSKDGLLVEVDQLISEYIDKKSVGKASSELIKSQFLSLGIASAASSYSVTRSGFLQSRAQSEFQANLIEYEKGLFESGTLGPVMQVASQSQVTSGERFFSRVGGLAMQFMLGHTSQNK